MVYLSLTIFEIQIYNISKTNLQGKQFVFLTRNQKGEKKSDRMPFSILVSLLFTDSLEHLCWVELKHLVLLNNFVLTCFNIQSLFCQMSWVMMIFCLLFYDSVSFSKGPGAQQTCYHRVSGSACDKRSIFVL